MTMKRVMTKARKHLGVEYPSTATEYMVELVPGKSIKIYRERNGIIEEGTSFVVGDEAEYDSYNLHYLGVIDSITEKCVTIVKVRGVSSKKHRLDLNQFCWRNFKFNAAKIRAENNETMMHI